MLQMKKISETAGIKVYSDDGLYFGDVEEARLGLRKRFLLYDTFKGSSFLVSDARFHLRYGLEGLRILEAIPNFVQNR